MLWAAAGAFAWLVVYSLVVPAVRWLPAPADARTLERGESIGGVARAGGWGAESGGDAGTDATPNAD